MKLRVTIGLNAKLQAESWLYPALSPIQRWPLVAMKSDQWQPCSLQKALLVRTYWGSVAPCRLIAFSGSVAPCMYFGDILQSFCVVLKAEMT